LTSFPGSDIYMSEQSFMDASQGFSRESIPMLAIGVFMRKAVYIGLLGMGVALSAATVRAAVSDDSIPGLPEIITRTDVTDARPDYILPDQPLLADSAAPDAPATEPTKGPPLPFHSIEGYSGGAITPMAYFANPPLSGALLGLPSASISYVNLGQKDLEAASVTENIANRFELGFAIDHIGLGDLRKDILTATKVDVHTDNVYIYNLNGRVNILPENSFDTKWIPAVTAGVDFKYNDGIANVNNRLGGALDGLGYRQPYGYDFTLTASKTIGDFFGRPLIATGGLLASEGAQIGALGFGKDYKLDPEASLAYWAFDQWVFAYEFRGNQDPYQQFGSLIRGQENWNAFDVAWIPNNRINVIAGIGYFGPIVNARADTAFWAEFKYEF